MKNKTYFDCNVDSCIHKHEKYKLELLESELREELDHWKDKCTTLQNIIESEKGGGEALSGITKKNVFLSHENEIIKNKIKSQKEQIDILNIQKTELERLLNDERLRIDEIETQYEKDDKIKELDKQIHSLKIQKGLLESEHRRMKLLLEKEERDINKARLKYNEIIAKIKPEITEEESKKMKLITRVWHKLKRKR